MTPRSSGWHDDPHDDDLLRYFDGIMWTEHTALKRPRPAPPREDPGAGGSSTVAPSSGSAASRGGATWGPQGSSWNGPGAGPGGWPAEPGGDRSSASWTGGPIPARAEDGTPRSGWWRRVAALILDNIVVTILALPFALPRRDELERGYAEMYRQASTGSFATPSPEFTQLLLVLSTTTVIITLVYEVGMLAWRGATLGRLMVGIRVRRLDAEGPLPWPLALRRSIIKFAGSIFGNLPLLGLAAMIFQLVDWFWPLGDARRQAIHDKVATTEVVVGRAPRRDRGREDDARPGAHRTRR